MRSLQGQMEWCRRIQLTLGIALAAGAVAFYVLGYRPAAKRLESLQTQMQAKERELAQNQARTSNMDYLAREVQKLEELARAYDRQFPRQAEFGQFIKDMTQIAHQLSLQEWKYEPGSQRQGDGYSELPILMHFQGDFLKVASFLRQMEEMQRLTRVKHVDVKARDGKSGVVQVEMAMSVYFSEG